MGFIRKGEHQQAVSGTRLQEVSQASLPELETANTPTISDREKSTRLISPHRVRDVSPGMAAKSQGGWMSARKRTTKPTGPVRNGFVVETAPEYDKRRIRALHNKRYRRSSVYQKHLKARKTNVMYRWRVFQEHGAHGVLVLRRLHVRGVFRRRTRAERGNVPEGKRCALL